MGWYESIYGGVFGDPVADLIDELGEQIKWDTPADIPSDVRSAIDELYRGGIGRGPTADDLKAVLGYLASTSRQSDQRFDSRQEQGEDHGTHNHAHISPGDGRATGRFNESSGLEGSADRRQPGAVRVRLRGQSEIGRRQRPPV